jgi:hypothetical protein
VSILERVANGYSFWNLYYSGYQFLELFHLVLHFLPLSLPISPSPLSVR